MVMALGSGAKWPEVRITFDTFDYKYEEVSFNPFIWYLEAHNGALFNFERFKLISYWQNDLTFSRVENLRWFTSLPAHFKRCLMQLVTPPPKIEYFSNSQHADHETYSYSRGNKNRLHKSNQPTHWVHLVFQFMWITKDAAIFYKYVSWVDSMHCIAHKGALMIKSYISYNML